MKNFKVRIVYIATDNTEHTIEAMFSTLPLALTKTKATCMKGDVKRVKKITVEEV